MLSMLEVHNFINHFILHLVLIIDDKLYCLYMYLLKKYMVSFLSTKLDNLLKQAIFAKINCYGYYCRNVKTL